MSENLFIRDILDWTALLTRTDRPFLTQFGGPTKIGEKNRYGQTYLGMSEPVDPEERAFAQGMMHIYGDIVKACGDGAWIEDENGYQEPAGTIEGMIAGWADREYDRWSVIERASGPQMMWEGEPELPKKVTWGWGSPLPLEPYPNLE